MLYIEDKTANLKIYLDAQEGQVSAPIRHCTTLADLLVAHVNHANLYICVMDEFIRIDEPLKEWNTTKGLWECVTPVKDRTCDRRQRRFTETSLEEVLIAGIEKLGCGAFSFEESDE